MSVIIYGVRPYGTVEAHGGEHAQTQFFHIWFAPLIPTGSYWITGRDGSTGQRGYSIGLHGKSVLAGYARVWGPIAALGTFVAGLDGNPLLLLISALAIALTVWTWTWRSVRGEPAQRRSDFNLVAFGTRCEPRRMGKELLGAFKRALDDRWHARKPDRTPNDIARHGTKDANEAIIAYGLLRIAAVVRGRAGREEDRDADRILEGAHSTLAFGEGPYREGVQEAPVSGSLAHVVKGMAVAHEVTADSSPEARAERATQQKRRSRKHLAGLILATPIALGMGAMFVHNMLPTRDVTIKELRATHPPTGRSVRVTCDSVEEPLWEELDSRGRTEHRITMCVLGQYLLPVQLDSDSAVPTKVIEGELREVTPRLVWVREGLSREPELEVRTVDVFVDASRSPYEKIPMDIFALAFVLGVPALWVLWFRARRRRKAEAAGDLA
ncbi:MAG TPA: hypothetical protein VIV40_05365 [Kofleriaceae bacterium]